MIIILFVRFLIEIFLVFLTICIGVSFAKGARNRYWILRFLDGKKHVFLLVIIILVSLLRVIDYFTHTGPATRGDVGKAASEIKESAEKQWASVLEEIMKGKWILDANWNTDGLVLIDKKVSTIIMADQAMWYRNGGDYAVYEELFELKNKDNELKPFVVDQLLRINSVLCLSNSAVRRIPLCKHGKNIGNKCLEVETENDFGVNNVLAQLSHPTYWTSRVKSAYLLHFLTPEMVQKSGVSWEIILDTLYLVFSGKNETHKNNNLLVRYMAWESFRRLTGFVDEKELFDVQKAAAWWENKENKEGVLKTLENCRKL